MQSGVHLRLACKIDLLPTLSLSLSVAYNTVAWYGTAKSKERNLLCHPCYTIIHLRFGNAPRAIVGVGMNSAATQQLVSQRLSINPILIKWRVVTAL